LDNHVAIKIAWSGWIEGFLGEIVENNEMWSFTLLVDAVLSASVRLDYYNLVHTGTRMVQRVIMSPVSSPTSGAIG
jgi:hypothetical protein